MSQRSVVESQTQSNLTPSLRSALKAALGTLDVQLEEELVRYRRSRGSQMPSARIGQQYQRKSLDLVSVGATGDRLSGDRPSKDEATTPQSAPSLVPMSQPQAQEEQTQPNDQPDALSSSLSSQSSQFALATTAPDRASAGLASAPIEELRGSLLDPATNHTGPDVYLESSEALLRSLGEEQPQKRTEPNFSESLLTPLGIGSMLLLLLASATLGYVVMNPATLTALKDHLYGKPSPPTATNPSEPINTTSASRGVMPLPNSPNLANREFVDLDLNTLSSVKPRVSNSPSVSTLVPTAKATLPTVQSTMQSTVQPRSTGDGSVTTSTPLPQTPRMQSVGIGLNAAPTQTPPLPVRRHYQKAGTQQSESAVPQPAAKYSSLSLSPSAQQGQSLTSNNYYYVVTDYGGGRNLEKARGVVADAYVDTSPQGTLIHLGALKSEAEAQKLAEELQRKGIQARIYRP